MPIEIRHPEWRDELESTNYPFDDQATLTNDAGDKIPIDLFVDAVLYPVGGDGILYLSAISVTGQTVTVTIGSETTADLATGTFSILSPPAQVQLADEFGRPAGLLVAQAAALGLFQAWSQGVHSFLFEDTRFVAAACVPLPEIGVRGYLLDNGDVVSGEVWLVGDEGIVLSAREQVLPGREGNTETIQVIRVDVVGDPLFRRRLCSPVFNTPRFLKSVTFRQDCAEFTCGPDEKGRIMLFAGSRYGPRTVLRVRPDKNVLTIGAVGDILGPTD